LNDQTEFNITKENVHSLKLLSEYLDNKSLLSKCELFSSKQPQVFRLNSKYFLTIPQHQLEFINDFIFMINIKQININHSLLCCVSNKFREMKDQEIQFDVPEEHFGCFTSFLNIFQGCEFNFEKFSLSSLMFLIDFFQCSSLFEFISSKLKSPQTIQESIDYLLKPNSEFFETYFRKRSSILIHQFENITREQFKFISN
jgi:hypothetical protein